MVVRRKIFAVLILALLPAISCQASSWMRQEGEISAMTGFSAGDIGNNFDRSGARFRDLCGTAYTAPLLAEYGASYYTTYFASSSLTTYGCGAAHVSGFTDFDFGVRGRTNLFANDQTWEVAAIIPSYVSPNGAANQPKHFGIRLGYNSSDRIDNYQSFSAGNMPGPNAFSYGLGVKTWTGHIPNELSGYLGWGHTITDAVWANDISGWYFSARLDGLKSFGKEHSTTVPVNVLGVVDRHDKFSLLTGSVALWRSLSPLSGIQLSANHGLWGRNISSPLGVHLSYSKTWRNN